MNEPYLGRPSKTSEILKKYDLSAKKKYGQNFLIDNGVLEGIIKAAAITKEDFVLEIGPGIGTLTQYLARYAGKVCSVEIDRGLLPVLEETLSGWDNTQIINGDILKTDISAIAERENGGKPIKIAANLPYYITTPIIMGLFEGGTPFESMTIMVQKEVAERIEATPGTKSYGALSIVVQYYAKPELNFIVPPHCFMPRPGVDSAVITLKRYDEPPVQVDDEALFFTVIKASFAQRRKKLSNGIANYPGLNFSREDVESALEEMGVSSGIRGERLSLQEFADLSNLLGKKRDS